MAAGTLDQSLSTPGDMNTTAAELVWWNLIGIETPHDLDAVTYGAAGLTALKEWEYGARTDEDTRLLLPAAGWPDKVGAGAGIVAYIVTLRESYSAYLSH